MGGFFCFIALLTVPFLGGFVVLAGNLTIGMSDFLFTFSMFVLFCFFTFWADKASPYTFFIHLHAGSVGPGHEHLTHRH